MQGYAQVLGTVVRNARLELGLTQNEVAERADIDVRTVLNIENQKGNPKLEVLFPLIRELKVDPNAVFYPEVSQIHSSISQLAILLSQCTEDEARCLIPICESILSVIRTNHVIQLQNEQ